MEKLTCIYDNITEAETCCDFCGAPLCSICGYIKEGKRYCNECWEKEGSGK